MAYDAHLYRDPAIVLQNKQQHIARKEAACGDCVHRVVLHMRDDYNACDLRRRYGWRCISYEPKGAQ